MSECEYYRKCPNCGDVFDALNVRGDGFLCPDCVTAGGGWLTVPQAAVYLHETGKTEAVVSYSTIQRWAREGKLQGVRWGRGHGGALHFRRDHLDEFTPPTDGARTGPPARNTKGAGK